MKSFTIKECRQCSAKTLQEESSVIINPGEEVDIVIITTAKCDLCKIKQGRSASGLKLPFTGK